ncbi:DUF6455 family protein [Ruegeria lacuscaerulensis]|uniref:DUF6455 family protein n=1 Tax=Ruegeria lacuscaerulensis TaxID=55218 RepID=UPI0022AA6F5E|nr:DUF6455 family protein [Ruegeria lacuscaerulensis]
MQTLGAVMTHLRLVLRMGQATGADVVSAHRQGRLSQEDWASMVRACQGCAWARCCPDWLDQNKGATQAPRTCPNRARFATLRSGKTREG